MTCSAWKACSSQQCQGSGSRHALVNRGRQARTGSRGDGAGQGRAGGRAARLPAPPAPPPKDPHQGLPPPTCFGFRGSGQASTLRLDRAWAPSAPWAGATGISEPPLPLLLVLLTPKEITQPASGLRAPLQLPVRLLTVLSEFLCATPALLSCQASKSRLVPQPRVGRPLLRRRGGCWDPCLGGRLSPDWHVVGAEPGDLLLRPLRSTWGH